MHTMETAQKKGWFTRNSLAILYTIGILVVAGVGTVTGYASWGHIVSVGKSVNESAAPLLPFCIDGMMFASTVMAAIDRLRGYKTRPFAVIGLWSGTLLTLGFNLLSAYTRGIPAMLIAVLFAVAFVISVEMVFHPGMTPLPAAKKAKNKEIESIVPAPVAVAEPVAVVQPTNNTPGRPGRRAGEPQVPSEFRRHSKGKSPGMTERQRAEARRRQQQEPKPIKVVAVMDESPKKDELTDLPLAMGDTLADLIATSPEPSNQ